MKCQEYSTCANYVHESIKCCFMYRWCQTRRDIETARVHMTAETNFGKIRQSTKGLDSFADTPEREGAEL